MASVLGDSGLLSKLDADVRANELFYHGNCLKTFKFRYQKCLENVDKKTEKEMNYYLNAVALDRTIRHLKERAYDQPESPVTVSSIMEKLNSYIEKEGLPHENHITRFGDLILEFVLSTKSADKKSWSSYHVTKQVDTIPTPCNKSIFPLLKNVVHTFDMQHHLISLFIEYTAVINPNQVTSVDCSDQPIYALSKINQWLFPKFAPPKYFPIFGGLHIEKALLTSHGLLIGGSGLEDILGDKQIETIGLQTAAVDVNHIHKGRYAIQLSSTAIFACLKAAYTQSQSDNPLLNWANEMAKQNLMFRYWFIILNFQIDYLVFVKSLREGKFLLFINVLKSLIKWFFIFDQYNYSRWIGVRVQDLLTLPVTCPELYQEFFDGNFVAQITNKSFSKIHFDQAHEQSNKTIKSISGPINFVNRADENLQRRWEIAGPEIADFLENIENDMRDSTSSDANHHEDSPSHNSTFLKESSVVMSPLLPLNPF